MKAEELHALADKVNTLSPPQRLRLAADLLERRRASTALAIIRRIADELEMALLLAKEGSRAGRGVSRGKGGE